MSISNALHQNDSCRLKRWLHWPSRNATRSNDVCHSRRASLSRCEGREPRGASSVPVVPGCMPRSQTLRCSDTLPLSNVILPGIEMRRARLFEIANIPRDHGHAVNECRCRDIRVTVVPPIRNMKVSASSRNRRIDRKNPLGECRQNLILQPGAKCTALAGVLARDLCHAQLEFENGNHRNMEHGGIHRLGPFGDAFIRLAGTGLAQLRHHIGV